MQLLSMKVKVVYNNIRDKELIVMIQTSAPFFVDFIDSKTRNGKKEAYIPNTPPTIDSKINF